MEVPRFFRQAIRDLDRDPGFSITVVAILSLAIGSNVAIFNFINLLGWKSVPARAPEELVSIWTGDENASLDGYGWNSYPDFEYYRDHSEGVFSGVLGWMVNLASLDTAREHAEWTECWSVSGNYFQLLGVETTLGRVLAPRDDRPGAERVAVLSHAFWRERFGSDPNVLGGSLRLNGHPFTVVGVVEDGFRGTWAARKADLWVTKRNMDVLRSPEVDWRHGGDVRWVGIVARLAPGVSIEQAEDATRRRGQELQELYPDPKRTRKPHVVAATMVPPFERERYLPTARMLGWTVGFVLFIACANTAIMFLVRGVDRQHELATRLAIGATRARLVQQLLTQAFVLSALGCVGGLVVGAAGSRLVVHYVEPYAEHLKLDFNGLLFVLGLAVLVPLLFGLVPALLFSRPDLVSSLKVGKERGGSSAWADGLRTTLVVVQIALAFVLVLGSSLLNRSVGELRAVQLGFDPSGVVMAQLNLAQRGYSESEGRRVFQTLIDRLETTGDATSAGVVRFAPLQGITRDIELVRPEAPAGPVSVNYNIIGPGYFETLGIPLLAGRGLNRQDDEEAAGAIVISRSAAEALWPGQSALGRSVLVEQLDREGIGPRFEVVGVAEDSLYAGISRETPAPLVYFSFHQAYQASLKLVLRSPGLSGGVADPLLRDRVAEIDPSLALGEVTTLAEYVEGALWEERMYSQVAAVFAFLGLVVALWGVYSVISYAVTHRSRELGIRLALGAGRRDVLGLILGRGALMLALGVGLGLLLSYWLIRWIESFLFGVSAHDPAVILAVSVGVAAVGGLACYLPARRAARLEPLDTLRWE